MNTRIRKVITTSVVMAFCFVWDSTDEQHSATVRRTVVTASDLETAVARVEIYAEKDVKTVAKTNKM